MLKQYFKQAIGMLRENLLVNAISILGTALSIAMIMVIVILMQVKLTGYSPESARGRMLFIYGTSAIARNESTSNNGGMSARIVKECLYAMQTPEAVSASFTEERAVSLPAKRLFEEYTIRYTDPGCWKVFDYNFVDGKPFTESDFDSAIPVAVITKELADKLFGGEEPVGRTIVIDYADYRVCGVVKPVSRAARDAFSHIWVPYTCHTGKYTYARAENLSGYFNAVMLARSSNDFDAVRKELAQKVAQINAGQKEYDLSFGPNPYDRLDILAGSRGVRKVDLKEYLMNTGALLLFLLLVPALNLTSVVQSSVRKRQSEMGLRKAFGATKGTLVMQVLSENMVITFFGGIIGLLLSVGLFFLGKSILLGANMAVTSEMLLQPGLFAAALLFAFVLNILSAALPAFNISRQQIVDALTDK
ncbi:ABC transporter permease [Parabacteroides sp.]